LLSPDDSRSHTRTETALRMMTPEYASPEQARGEPVATTTDVYSLGVVLYELLAERRPHEFRTYSPADIERAICETAVEEPSKAVSRMTGAPARLARQLSGDLDNIVMMAMRVEPERRYQSVEQLSEDIRRYLEGMPVLARKDTFRYRAGKFVRRYKAGVAILSLLITLAAATAVQSSRIARERDRANQEAATAQAVTQSLVAMFEFADPGKTRGNLITTKELLDQGAEKAVRELKNQPIVQAKLLDTIGKLYQSIGLYDRAQPRMEEALKIRRRALGNESLDVATSLKHLAELAYLKGDYAGSESLFREALDMRSKLLGAEHKDVAESMNNLGELLVDRGKFGEAAMLLWGAVALRRKLLGAESAEVANSLDDLGRLMSDMGKFQEAELLYRQSLGIRRKLYGPEHPLVAHSLNNQAVVLREQGEFKAAETLFRQSLEMRRRLLGEEHPEVTVSLVDLASVLQSLRRYDEAEQLLGQALAMRRRIFGEEHPRVATTMNNLAALLRDKGDYEKAEDLFRRSLAMRRRLLGDAHPEVGASLHDFALLLYLKGECNAAEKTEREAIDTYLKSLKPDHWLIHQSRINLGACLIKLKRYPEAEEQLLAGYAELKASRGAQHAQTQSAADHLIELYEAWGKSEKARPYYALPHTNPEKSKK
jgi:eukaryotic-like serine/threonine-protein kinase